MSIEKLYFITIILSIFGFLTSCQKSNIDYYLRTGDGAIHIKDTEREVVSDSITPLNYYFIAKGFCDSDSIEKAYLAIQRAYELLPNDIDIINQKALCELELGKYKDCVKTIEIIENGYGNTAETHLIRYYVHLTQGGSKKALRSLNHAIRDYPQLPQFYYLSGDLLMKERRYRRAIKYLEKAVELDPTDSNYLLRRGTAYFYSGKVEKGRDDWNQSLMMGNIKATHYIKTYLK